MSQLVLMQPALDGVAADMLDPDNRNLLDRWGATADWLEDRAVRGLDAGEKVQTGRIGPRALMGDCRDRVLSGVNFASEDALGLGSHPRLLAAAQAAVARHGVHSAGARRDAGVTAILRALEPRVAAGLGLRQATVFPSGWAAGHAAVRALVREGDHVLVDADAPAGLAEAALAATRSVQRLRAGPVQALAERLERIRAQEPDAGILVAVSALRPGRAEAVDLAALTALCRRHEAVLLVDVSHDLGLLGPGGGGVIAMQRAAGGIDVVTGSLARGFAAEAGFVAGDHPGLAAALRHGAGAFDAAHAIAPAQAATALAAFDVVTGPEGEALRARLLANSRRLRGLMAEAGFTVTGMAGPVVPVRLGAPAFARRMTAGMLAGGVILNLDEPPVTPANACRWRFHVMATHRESDIDMAARTARQMLRRIGAGAADPFGDL